MSHAKVPSIFTEPNKKIMGGIWWTCHFQIWESVRLDSSISNFKWWRSCWTLISLPVHFTWRALDNLPWVNSNNTCHGWHVAQFDESRDELLSEGTKSHSAPGVGDGTQRAVVKFKKQMPNIFQDGYYMLLLCLDEIWWDVPHKFWVSKKKTASLMGLIYTPK